MAKDFEEEWGFAPDSDYEIRKTNKPQADFFPMGALAVLGALEGKSAEEMAQSLLEQEIKLEEKKVSCNKCEEEPIQTYIRVGKANVAIMGCEEHLKELIEIYRKGLKCDA